MTRPIDQAIADARRAGGLVKRLDSARAALRRLLERLERESS